MFKHNNVAINYGLPITPKFQIGDDVWVIEDNRFERKRITGISIFMREKSCRILYELECRKKSGLTYLYPEPENLHKEDVVFATLEQLIEAYKTLAIIKTTNSQITL